MAMLNRLPLTGAEGPQTTAHPPFVVYGKLDRVPRGLSRRVKPATSELTTYARRRILASMDAEERLRLDYDQTMQQLRTVTDVRFKLLAFVPTIAGAAVGLVGHPRSAAELIGIGLLGFVATLGVFLYELRNSQVLDAVIR